MANTNINVRVDSEIKSQTNDILNSLGLDMTTAINIYLRKIIDCQGIPFSVCKKYNKEAEDAIEEARKIENGEINVKSYSNAHEMLEDILSEDSEE